MSDHDEAELVSDRSLVGMFLATIVAATVCVCIAYGCAPSVPTAQTLQGSDCVAARTTLQLQCILQYDAGAAIDACRERVKASVDCLASPDGGSKP